MTTCYFAAEEATLNTPCTVEINEKTISVRYEEDEGGSVNYAGKNDGNGHFRLSGSDGGKASLHMFPDSNILEGYWTANTCSGMWRIDTGMGVSDTYNDPKIAWREKLRTLTDYGAPYLLAGVLAYYSWWVWPTHILDVGLATLTLGMLVEAFLSVTFALWALRILVLFRGDR